MRQSVSIVIVNYNTRELLSNCLQSVYDNTAGVAYEVIIVDNASTDGSEAYITSRFPDVKWIGSKENLGFGKGNNLGMNMANGEYLFLLNSDTILRNNAIKIFYDYAEDHKSENIGALGCWLKTKEGSIGASYGFFPSVHYELSYLAGKVKRKTQETPSEKDVDYIIGADLFMRRDLFNELGGFDPNFFMYYEETDLQKRMEQRGKSRRLILGPEIVHLEGGSFGKSGLTYRRFVMAQKSYNYYLRKHKKGMAFLWHKTMLGIIRLTVLAQKGWTWRERLSAYSLVWGDNANGHDKQHICGVPTK